MADLCAHAGYVPGCLSCDIAKDARDRNRDRLDTLDAKRAIHELADALLVQFDAARVDGYPLEQRRYARALALHYVARCDHAKPGQPTPRSLGTACVACVTEALLGVMRAWTPVPKPEPTAPPAKLHWFIEPPAPGEKYRRKTARISHADVLEQLAGGKDLQLEVEVLFEKSAPATTAPGASTVSPPKPEPTAPMPPIVEFADQLRTLDLGDQIVHRGDGSMVIEHVAVSVRADEHGRQLGVQYLFTPPKGQKGG